MLSYEIVLVNGGTLASGVIARTCDDAIDVYLSWFDGREGGPERIAGIENRAVLVTGPYAGRELMALETVVRPPRPSQAELARRHGDIAEMDRSRRAGIRAVR